MTQPDPFAAATVNGQQIYAPPAQAYAAPPVQQYASQAGYAHPAPAASTLTPARSSLIPTMGVSLLALFNKTHAPGTSFRGVVSEKPKDVQSTSHPQNPGDRRELLYWSDITGKRKPSTMAIDPRTGRPNEPVMDLVIELQTQDRFTPQQLIAINRPADYSDGGRRNWQISGSNNPPGHVKGQPTNARRALTDAIESAIGRGIPIDDDSFVGLALVVTRVERLQPGVGTSPWTYLVQIDRA